MQSGAAKTGIYANLIFNHFGSRLLFSSGKQVMKQLEEVQLVNHRSALEMSQV